MGRRLTPDEKLLRAKGAPLVGAVVAYGTREDGYRVGRVEAVEVDREDDDLDPMIVLTLSNKYMPSRWLAAWDPWSVAIVDQISDREV